MNTKNAIITCDKGYEVLGVQPLLMSHEELQAFNNKNQPQKLEAPAWYNRVNSYSRNQFHLFTCLFNQTLSFANYTKLAAAQFQLKVYLGKSLLLNQAIIIYELKHLAGEHEQLSLNELRDAFVIKESHEPEAITTELSRLINQLRQEALNYTKTKLGIKTARIETNSCNLTLFSTNQQPSITFIDDVERVTTAREEINISNQTKLLFGGRLHLVIGDYESELDLTKAMLFKLQVTWFYVPKYAKEAMDSFQQSILEKQSTSYFRNQASNIIKIHRVVSIQNDLSNLALDALQAAYDLCQKRWSVEDNLAALGEFAEYFMEQAEAEHRQAQERKSSILNYILGILAFIGIASFPADFLTTLYYAGEYNNLNSFWRIMLYSPLAWMSWAILTILAVALVLLLTTLITAIKNKE